MTTKLALLCNASFTQFVQFTAVGWLCILYPIPFGLGLVCYNYLLRLLATVITLLWVVMGSNIAVQLYLPTHLSLLLLLLSLLSLAASVGSDACICSCVFSRAGVRVTVITFATIPGLHGNILPLVFVVLNMILRHDAFGALKSLSRPIPSLLLPFPLLPCGFYSLPSPSISLFCPALFFLSWTPPRRPKNS